MLKEIVEKGFYTFKDSFASWEDAVRGSYEPLQKCKIVDDTYINKCDRMRKNMTIYRSSFQELPCTFNRGRRMVVMEQRYLL